MLGMKGRKTVAAALGLMMAFALLPAQNEALAETDYTSIPTPNILVVDADDPSQVFFERNADQRAFPASTTKIITCILTLENGNLDEAVTVGEEVLGTERKFTQYSSLMGLVPGETVTLRDLVYGLMLVSGNDAAEAIAVHMAGSIGAFADMMNAKAAELNMSGTHFTNPHGVQNDNHYTTARDLAKAAAYALKNPDFVEIVTTPSYSVAANELRPNALTLNNTNLLIKKPDTVTEDYTYPYAIGVKTGSTVAAGNCLVAAAEKDGARIIAVLLGDTAEMYGGDSVTGLNIRFQHAKDIFTDLFATRYQSLTAADLALPAQVEVAVENGNPDDLTDGKLIVPVDISAFRLTGLDTKLAMYSQNADRITPQVQLDGEIAAPVEAGARLGTVNYVLDGEVLFSGELIAPQTVREKTALQSLFTQDPGKPAVSPGSEPLVQKQGMKIGVIGWLLIVLILLLLALIAIFVHSEKKRKRRMERRALRTRKAPRR